MHYVINESSLCVHFFVVDLKNRCMDVKYIEKK